MRDWSQRTLARRVSCAGVGLHSGAPAAVALAPAPPDSGYAFVRRDLRAAGAGEAELPARAAHVVDTTLGTSLGRDGVRVATVEHVLAALAGLGIDNCRIEVDGPEVPILDGSAAPFAALVEQAGTRAQAVGRRWLVVREAVEVRDGDRWARLEPARAPSLRFTVDYRHPLISDQTFELELTPAAFAREVAPARTFCLLRDVERMRAGGLARGGSLENAVVVGEFSVLNPGGLRFPDEFARHKLLDALGDLALLGMPVLGRFTACRSGHALNQALVRAVLADARAHRVVRVAVGQNPGDAPAPLPARGVPEPA